MVTSERNVNIAAEDYSKHHGADAYKKVGEDISMAVGKRDWDNAHMLQQVQRQVWKLERSRQIAGDGRQLPTHP